MSMVLYLGLHYILISGLLDKLKNTGQLLRYQRLLESQQNAQMSNNNSGSGVMDTGSSDNGNLFKASVLACTVVFRKGNIRS